MASHLRKLASIIEMWLFLAVELTIGKTLFQEGGRGMVGMLRDHVTQVDYVFLNCKFQIVGKINGSEMVKQCL